ncbi:MAG TPA: EamA family transporter [Plasticicumulans sp.]|nr:EamA family transporter [Plasticicumulans sp.]
MSDARLRATLTGAVAILLWATLALGATLSAGLPPFELLALTFSIGGLAGLAVVARGGRLARLRQPPAAFALGVAGLFGYHFFYFVALAHAPPVDASLINYLWPLLIVLFSGLLPGERLQRHHLGGGLLGLAGAWVLISGGGTAPRLEYLPGYVSALACAFVWSGYTVLNRRFAGLPTDGVAGQCLAVAVLAALCHAAWEPTVRPSAVQWAVIGWLGLGPLGFAFYVWDHGSKHGDLQLLGVLSYATPVLSTLLLLAAGRGEPGWPVALACALIVGGALLASGRFRRG